MSPVEKAALAWWKSHRPVGDSEADHLRWPRVNTCRDSAGDLAEAVAQMVRERKALNRKGRDLKAERKARAAKGGGK